MMQRTPQKSEEPILRRVDRNQYRHLRDRREQTEGSITTLIRGKEVSVTVRLSRVWAVMLGAEDRGELKDAAAAVSRIWKWFDCACKVVSCLAILYFALEIGHAFLPGGAVHRVLESLR